MSIPTSEPGLLGFNALLIMVMSSSVSVCRNGMTTALYSAGMKVPPPAAARQRRHAVIEDAGHDGALQHRLGVGVAALKGQGAR